ncbi:MAG TPA: tetratricopeptide repeat protein [Edaphobacter sp.]|nr:tetratricopeptide repeat protein [Edaphobacter sp.]
MADQQELVEQLFDAALAIKPGDRSAFLDKVCGENLELKRSVESRLVKDPRAGSSLHPPTPGFLEKTTIDFRQSSQTNGRERSDQNTTPLESTNRPRPGDVLGERFLVIRFIARGGMGEVYEVEDLRLQGIHLALKTVLPQIADEPHMQKRFEREVLLARQVIHPNLCPIYDIFHCQGPAGPLTFLTMKLLPGETLGARMVRKTRIDLPEAACITKQVAAALTAIHDAGILHRDIKSSNIMLDGSGEQVRVSVMDFGLAHAYLTDGRTLTAVGVAGTPAYMAPELFRGQPPSKATDVYAFGVVIHEMLTGRLPHINSDNQLQTGKDVLFDGLPPEWKKAVRGCIEPDLSRRCRTIPEAMSPLGFEPSTQGYAAKPLHLSRRRMIQMGAGASSLALAGGLWFEWPRIDLWIHPIPEKRFVALMAWPVGPGESAPIVSTVLGTIRSRLARAEAYVKNLLIIAPSDITSTSPATPAESVNALGANLVLAASLQSTPNTVTLLLQVLDAATQRLLRRHHITSSRADISSLADKGSSAAARLLGLPDQDKTARDTDELLGISPAAFSLFSQAEQLAAQPNNTGLDAAILKYAECLEKEPHFRLGYARLAIAYTRKYRVLHDPAILNLARQNAEKAADSNSTSATGLLSRALVYLYTGDTNNAMTYFTRALKADPGNPEIMLYRAQALRNTNRWPEAEQTYREILKERPNYWPANNELGWILFRQAKYQQAADAFDAAAMAAPNVARPLANLGEMYIALGKHDEAIDASQRSIQRSPNETAYRNLGDIAFSDGNYKNALANYQQAANLDPKYHMIWRDIGDCYAMLGQPALVRENYAKAARLLSEELQDNPRSGPTWMTLAFYHAKIGNAASAATDIENAERRGAGDVESQFTKVQALALLGKKEDATKLLLTCMDRGLSPVEVDFALDLREIRKDPRYLSRVAKKPSTPRPAAS